MRGANNATSALGHVPVQFDTTNEMEKRRLTDASKIAIDRPKYHDRRDAIQTNHAENEDAARSGRYDHQPGHANAGCNESGR